MKKVKFISVLLFAFLSFTFFGYSQVQLKGEITGIVVDEQGEALPGVTVNLSGEKLFQKTLSVMTSVKGAFRFLNLNPGVYELEFALMGFTTVKQTNVSVHVGKSTPVRTKLTPTTVKEKVIVVSEAPLIETKTAQLATNIDSILVENIPVPRNLSTFTGLMNTVPGINDNLAYGSAGGVESSDLSYGSYTSAYRFDGLDVSNPRVGYTSVNPIYETIEELQVVGIGATAEYGNYVGASINIVTKSGSNEFHGSITGLYNNDSLRSDNSGGNEFLAPQKFKYDLEATFTLSGPLIKEKMFFFLGGGFVGNEKMWPIFTEYQTSKRYRAYAKLDFLVNNTNTLTAMFNMNPCFIKNTGLMPGWAKSTAVNYDLSVMNSLFVTWQSILSEKTYFNLKVAGWQEDYNYYPAYPGVPMWMELGTSSYYGSYMQDQRIPSSSYEGNFTLSHYAEELFGAFHEIKFGAEYHYAQVTTDSVYSGGGYFLSIPMGAITLWQAYTGGDTHTKGMINRFCTYLQDNLKIGQKLSLNLGLRYENIKVTARDFTGNIASYNTLSPRIGFSYDITGDAKNVIHASFGMYYNKVLLNTYRRCMPGNEDQYTFMAMLPTTSMEPTDQNLKDMFALITQPQNLISTSYMADPIPVDPDLKLARADIFSVGYSRKLGRDFAVSIDYTYKKDLNRYMFKSLVEHTYQEFQWTDPWLGNTVTLWQQMDSTPDTERIFTNSEWLKKRHHFLMIVLRKQPSRKWTMMFSYVYQNTKSNMDGASDLGGYGGWNFDTDPHFYKNPLWNGRENDREHQFKLLGTYFGPFGINISGNLQALSGVPWAAQTYSSYVSGAGVPAGPSGTHLYRSTGSVYIYLEQRGSRRAPFNWNFDVRIAKAFKIKGSHLEFRIDIFNLFNNDYHAYIMPRPNTNYPTTGEPAFGKPWRLEPPRNIYIGFTWRF